MRFFAFLAILYTVAFGISGADVHCGELYGIQPLSAPTLCQRLIYNKPTGYLVSEHCVCSFYRSNDECDPSNAVTLTNDTVAPDRFDDGDEFNLHSCWVVPSNLGV